MTTPAGELVLFICYARQDHGYMTVLRDHLRELEKTARLRVWCDEQIDPGAQWNDELRKAIASADIAILLVSKHFSASRFIQDEELPALQQREPKVLLVPLLVRAVDWTGHSLSRYQALLDARPIEDHEDDAAWSAAVEELRARVIAPRALRAPRPVSRTVRLSMAGWVVVVLLGFLVTLGIALYADERRIASVLADAQRALDLGDWAHARALLTPLLGHWWAGAKAALGRDVGGLYLDSNDWDRQQFEDRLATLAARSNELGGLFNAHLRSVRAARRLYAGELDEAERDFTHALEDKTLPSRPQMIEARLGLGTLKLWRGKLDEAITHFDFARRLAEDSAPVLAALAWAHACKGELERARALYHRCLKMEPDYIQGYWELARVERSAGERTEALTQLQQGEKHLGKLDFSNEARPWGYPVNRSIVPGNSVSGEPWIVWLDSPARKRYAYRLSMALSACFAGNAEELERNFTAARSEPGLTRSEINRVYLLLKDEALSNPALKTCDDFLRQVTR